MFKRSANVLINAYAQRYHRTVYTLLMGYEREVYARNIEQIKFILYEPTSSL